MVEIWFVISAVMMMETIGDAIAYSSIGGKTYKLIVFVIATFFGVNCVVMAFRLPHVIVYSTIGLLVLARVFDAVLTGIVLSAFAKKEK